MYLLNIYSDYSNEYFFRRPRHILDLLKNPQGICRTYRQTLQMSVGPRTFLVCKIETNYTCSCNKYYTHLRVHLMRIDIAA